MTRISLRETYDNRSVIAQIAKVTDTAEDAAETVQEKAAEINDALTYVNAAVQAAEGAVTTANAANASAQQSAQTVAGYENRLATAESDLGAVTLRVQTAEGDIVTIQGRVTALETADGQNVKINAINNYAVGLTGNQTSSGTKTWTGQQMFNQDVIRRSINIHNLIRDEVNDRKVTDGSIWYSGRTRYYDQDGVEFGRFYFRVNANGTSTFGCEVRNSDGSFKFISLGNGDVI